MRALTAPRHHVRHLARVIVVAMLATLVHVVAAAPASAGQPTGDVNDVVSPEPGKVQLRGWAVDPSDQSLSVGVHVYFGPPGADYGVDIGAANTYRPDVPINGGYQGDYHGFDTVITVPIAGDVEWRVYLIDPHGTSNVLIETGRVTIADATPSGAVESISSPAHRTVSLAGWASDPSKPASSVAIEAYVGGSFNTPGVEFHPLTASLARSDGKRGFSGQFTTAKTGTQDVYVYAKNVPGTPGADRLIAVVKVTVFVDSTPPETTITSAPKVATPQDVIRVDFTTNEPNATFECRWDGASWAACKTGTTLLLTPGQHTFEVRARDAAGNADPTPAAAVVVVTGYVTQPPPTGTERALKVGAVKKKSRLRINVDPDYTDSNYRVVVKRKAGKRWRKVARVRTRGEDHVVVVDLRRGKYRVVLPASADGPALTSATVRLRR